MFGGSLFVVHCFMFVVRRLLLVVCYSVLFVMLCLCVCRSFCVVFCWLFVVRVVFCVARC